MTKSLLGETGISTAVKTETGPSSGGGDGDGAVRMEIEDRNSSSVKKKKKTTQGRKKIENDKIRQVTFSKRRAALFKTASQLSTLYGAKVEIIVHLPGKRVFTFGYPSTDPVVDGFLGTAAAAQQEDGEEVQSSNAAERMELEAMINEMESRVMAIRSRIEEEQLSMEKVEGDTI